MVYLSMKLDGLLLVLYSVRPTQLKLVVPPIYIHRHMHTSTPVRSSLSLSPFLLPSPSRSVQESWKVTSDKQQKRKKTKKEKNKKEENSDFVCVLVQ